MDGPTIIVAAPPRQFIGLQNSVFGRHDLYRVYYDQRLGYSLNHRSISYWLISTMKKR